MNLAEEAASMKKQVEKARSLRDKAQGRLDQTKKRLKEDFKVSTLAKGKTLYAKLGNELEELQDKYDEAKQEFDGAWAALNDGLK